MQPATDQSGGSSGAMRRWGPIIAIVLIAAIAAAVVAMSGGDDDPESGGDGGTDGAEAPDVTNADGEPVYPFSWADGEASGLRDLEWGDRCDTERGTLAIPDVAAQPCYLPFDGDNGGATADGVTADTIKIVVYLGPDNDPVINYITDAIQVDDTNADTKDTLNNLISFYETYHETYGRHVEIE